MLFAERRNRRKKGYILGLSVNRHGMIDRRALWFLFILLMGVFAAIAAMLVLSG